MYDMPVFLCGPSLFFLESLACMPGVKMKKRKCDKNDNGTKKKKEKRPEGDVFIDPKEICTLMMTMLFLFSLYSPLISLAPFFYS